MTMAQSIMSTDKYGYARAAQVGRYTRESDDGAQVCCTMLWLPVPCLGNETLSDDGLLPPSIYLAAGCVVV